jgi:hypothetical protein
MSNVYECRLIVEKYCRALSRRSSMGRYESFADASCCEELVLDH